MPNNTVATRKLPAPLYSIQRAVRNRKLTPEEIAWDDYLIPGLSWPVLRNKVGMKNEPYGCTDGDVLAERETRFTAFRMVQLREQPIPGNFDLEHMKAIHKQLFQDVYEWAGEQRTVPLAKAGHSYAEAHQVETIWNEQHAALADANFLRDITDPQEFAEQLAFHWGMVNVAHAFREGNTRSQTMFFHQLAKEAGWDLNVSMLGPEHARSVRDEFVEARYHYQENSFDERPLAAALAKTLTRREPELQRELGAPAPRKHVWAKPKAPAPVEPRSPWAEPLDAVAAAPAAAEEPKLIEPIDLEERFKRYPELAPESEPRHRVEPDGPLF